MKKFLMLMLTLTIAVTLAACGDDSKDKEKDEGQVDEETAEQANEDVEVTDEEKVKDDDVVVNINDSGVKGTHYNVIYAQTKMQMQQLGQDTKDVDAIKEHALDELIAQELVMQDADDKGVKVSDKEVDKELKNFKEENDENFQAYLDEFDLSEETYKEQLFFSLVLDKYVAEEIDAKEATDEEAKETYDNMKEQNDELPEFDEIKDDLKQQLQGQKKQEQLQAKIEKLKKSADIEKLI